MAGQFFHRFRPAGRDSALGVRRCRAGRSMAPGTERASARRRRNTFGRLRTRCRSWALVIVDEEHDGSYKQQESPRYHGRDVALMRAKEAGCRRRSWIGYAQRGEPLQRRGRQVHLAPLTGTHRPAALCPKSRLWTCASSSWKRKSKSTFSRKAAGGNGASPCARRTDHAAAEPARLFEFYGLPRVRRTIAVHKLFRGVDASSARPPHALSLLRLCREGSNRVSQVRQRSRAVSRVRVRSE